MAARTPGSGPNTVSLLASLIEPGTVLPGTYTGSPTSSGRRRAVTSTAYVGAVYAMPPAVQGRLERVRVPSGSPMEACQSGRMGLTANELSPFKGTGGSNPLASAA